MKNQTKHYSKSYGWHLSYISSHTYFQRTKYQWVRRSRVTDSRNWRNGGISTDTVMIMVREGLVKIDGRILRITPKGKHVVNTYRDAEVVKQRKAYLRRGDH